MSKEFKPQGLITDFDNTLVKTHGFIRDHLQNTCKKLGVETPGDEEIFQVLESNPPFEEIFDELFADQAQLVLSTYRENAMETHYHPTDGGTEFINILRKSGVKIIIVSNRTRKLKERLEQAGYDPSWFFAILSPEKPKPDKNAYRSALLALETAKVDRQSIYIIGDSPDDYQACPDNLKKNFYAIISGVNKPQDFESLDLPKSHIVDSPKDLLDKLNGRN